MNNSQPFEPVRDATTPAEMRAEIARLRYDNPIVRAAMDSADYTGLSSEDRYTMLAYYALRSGQQAKRALYEHALVTPVQPFFFPEATKPQA